MSCPERSGKEAMLALMAFADGELDEAEAAKVRAHLAICGSCREEVEAVRALDRSLRAAFSERPRGAPEAAKRRIERALESYIPKSGFPAARRARFPNIVRRTGALLGALAALVLAVALVFGIFPDPVAADLVKDHLGCMSMRSDWVTDPATIAAILSRECGPGAVLVSLEAAGYRLRGAFVCEIEGRRHVHLGFMAPGKPPASVYLVPKEARSLFRKTKTLVPGDLPLAVARIRGRSNVEAVLVAPPAERRFLARLIEEQLGSENGRAGRQSR